jgi:hypothetical protein
MSGAEAAAWWTEVEELRERIERRRTLQAESREGEARGPRAVGVVAEAASEPAHWSDEPSRRTVRIRGQAIPTVVAPRLRPGDSGAELEPSADRSPAVGRRPYGTTRPARPRPRAAERIGSSPDRLAAWAFAFALLTLLVAAISAHGL